MLIIAIGFVAATIEVRWTEPEYVADTTGYVTHVRRDGKDWEVTAEFVDQWGAHRTVTSETRRPPPQIGDDVGIDYGRVDAQIAGMSEDVTRWWVLPALVPFYLFGVFLAARGWRKGGQAERLLRRGVLARGTLVEVRRGGFASKRTETLLHNRVTRAR